MVDGPNKCLVTEAATAVIFSARSLREESPDDDLQVNMAWIQMAESSWEEQQRMSVIKSPLVSLRKKHDVFPTTIRWPDPKSYIAHRERRAHAANQAHQHSASPPALRSGRWP